MHERPAQASVGTGLRRRLPEIVRNVLITLILIIAIAAALAPVVYLLRRIGVG